MKHGHAVLQIIVLVVAILLMNLAIAESGTRSMMAAAISMVMMVVDAAVFASSSRDLFSKILAVLVTVFAILSASAVCIGSLIPEPLPVEEPVVEEEPAEEEVVVSPEPAEEEPAPEIPAAPVLSVKSQEVTTGEPEAIAGKGSASIPSAPEVFNLLWIE